MPKSNGLAGLMRAVRTEPGVRVERLAARLGVRVPTLTRWAGGRAKREWGEGHDEEREEDSLQGWSDPLRRRGYGGWVAANDRKTFRENRSAAFALH